MKKSPKEMDIVLVEDSRLVSLCWKLHLSGKAELSLFESPQELLGKWNQISIHEHTIFIFDLDFKGRDSLSGLDLAEALRARGHRNPIYLYSGFTESLPTDLLARNIVNGIWSKDLTPEECLRMLN
jgi:DNA-binding NarL/FixJ family response regulator